jgi:hypothetical protein
LTVTVEASEASVRILQAGAEVARHQPASGRRQRVIDARHLEGVVGLYPSRPVPTASGADTPVPAVPAPDLLRPLAEYEAVLGGGW